MSNKPEQHIIHAHELTQHRNAPTQMHAVDHLCFDKPVLISLGGIDAVTAENAQKFAERRVWDLLGDGVYSDSLRQYVLTYESQALATENHPRMIASYYIKGKDSSAPKASQGFATDFIKKHLCPAIADVRELSPQARADALEDTTKLMKNLNFFTFSLGTILIRHVHDEMAKMLQEKGFTEQEIPKLMSGVKALCIGEMAHWKYETKDWHFKSVHLASHHDDLIKPMVAGHIKHLKDEPVQLEKPHQNMLIVHARIPKAGFHFADDGTTDSADMVERADPTGHAAVIHTRQRFTDSVGTIFTTTMMQSVLRNMVAASKEGRSIDLPEELLQVAPVEKGANDYLGHASGYGYKDRVAALSITQRSGRN